MSKKLKLSDVRNIVICAHIDRYKNKIKKISNSNTSSTHVHELLNKISIFTIPWWKPHFLDVFYKYPTKSKYVCYWYDGEGWHNDNIILTYYFWQYNKK